MLPVTILLQTPVPAIKIRFNVFELLLHFCNVIFLQISNTQNVTANNNEETITSCAMDGGSKEEAKAAYKAPTDPKIRYKKENQIRKKNPPCLRKHSKYSQKHHQLLQTRIPLTVIANELRKYDQHTLVYVKQALNHVIFEADLGKYSHYGHNNYYQQPNYNTSQSETPSPAFFCSF